MFSGLFSRKQPKKDAAHKNELPPEPVSLDAQYDPGLVTVLTEQHRELIMLLIRARSAAQQSRFEDVKITLSQFRVSLDDHLYQESVALLPYLSSRVNAEITRTSLKDMHNNTAHIERTVAGFLNHYLSYPVSERNAARFDIEIEQVSEEFTERIQREETTLYPLYAPPESY